MNHNPRRAIKLGDYVLADKTSLSKTVYKLRSMELSIQDALNLTVDCFGDIDFNGRFSYSFLTRLLRNNKLKIYLAFAIDKQFQL